MRGWVYVMSNKAMPGLVKVGYSMKDPEARADELQHTGSPFRPEVEFEAMVEEPRDVEQRAHRALQNCLEAKEWFRCTPEQAVVALRTAMGGKAILENFKRVDRQKLEAKLRADAESEAVASAQREASLRFQATQLAAQQEVFAEKQRDLFFAECNVVDDEYEATLKRFWWHRAVAIIEVVSLALCAGLISFLIFGAVLYPRLESAGSISILVFAVSGGFWAKDIPTEVKLKENRDAKLLELASVRGIISKVRS